MMGTFAMSLESNCLRAMLTFFLYLVVLCGRASAQTSPIELQYHLKTGDRLVYREVFDKQGTSQNSSFHSQMVFSSEVVVLASANGRSLVGIQRNRRSADLLDFRDRGRDVLMLQKPAFEQRVAGRPARFADSNVFSAAGQELLPLQVLREARSKLLYRISEIMSLPTAPMQVGSEWDSDTFGLRLRLEDFQAAGAESCALLADTGNHEDTHLHITFCPASGHLVKLDFEGRYKEFESSIHEHVTLELQSVQHGEAPDAWLARADTRLGALSAYLISTASLPPSEIMNEILSDGTHDAQALALAAYYQRNLAPATEVLTPLLKNENNEVRRLAGRFIQPVPQLAAEPCTPPAVSHKREKTGTTLHGMTTAAFPGAPFIMHVPLDYRGDRPFPSSCI